MIVYNYDADLEVSDTCVRSSLLSWVEYGQGSPASIPTSVVPGHILGSWGQLYCP